MKQPSEGKHFLSPSPPSETAKKRRTLPVFFKETPGGSLRELSPTEAHRQLPPRLAASTAASANPPGAHNNRVLAPKDPNAPLKKGSERELEIQDIPHFSTAQDQKKLLVRDIIRQGIAAAQAREQAHHRSTLQTNQEIPPVRPDGSRRNISTIGGLQRILNHSMRMDPRLEPAYVVQALSAAGGSSEMVTAQPVKGESYAQEDKRQDKKLLEKHMNERRPYV